MNFFRSPLFSEHCAYGSAAFLPVTPRNPAGCELGCSVLDLMLLLESLAGLASSAFRAAR